MKPLTLYVPAYDSIGLHDIFIRRHTCGNHWIFDMSKCPVDQTCTAHLRRLFRAMFRFDRSMI